MPIRVEVPYSKTFSSRHSQADAFAYFSDVEKSVPGNFPGVEGFELVEANTFRWVFEKVGYSGYELQIKLVTRFEKLAPDKIRVTPVAEAGACLFTGGWQILADGSGSKITFDVKFEMDLPVPGFLKGMAVPLAQKEMTKLFDRYIARVEKNFG